jgi:hypothetical protein
MGSKTIERQITMCMSCGCGKKKGEAGYGKGPKAVAKKASAKPAASMKKMDKKK